MMHAMTHAHGPGNHHPHHSHARSHLGCAAMVIGWTVLGLVFVSALALALGALLMVLWNWLMPELFGLPVLTYWQAVGLFILAHLLFKSPPHHGPPHGRGHHHHGHPAWVQRVRRRIHGSDPHAGCDAPRCETHKDRETPSDDSGYHPPH